MPTNPLVNLNGMVPASVKGAFDAAVAASGINNRSIAIEEAALQWAERIMAKETAAPPTHRWPAPLRGLIGRFGR
jgi:hypothetical protein